MTTKAGWGGKRSGAGRKPKPSEKIKITADDSLDFLNKVWANQGVDLKLRIRAAIAATRRVGEVGKKGEREKAAKQATAGKFAPGAPPPKLVINNG